jgi:hypothetical protein
VRKRLGKIIGTLFFLALLGGASPQIFAQGTPVIDMANLLQAIDAMYQQYQQVMNSIEQVKNTYKQIEQQASMVKNLDWSALDLSHLDPTNIPDLMDSAKNIKRMVEGNLKRLEEVAQTIGAKEVSFGGMSYTLKGLCGIGLDKMGIDSEMVFNMPRNIADYVIKTGKDIAEEFKKQLNPEQIAAIARRYDMNPEYFAVYKMTRQVMDNTIQELVTTASGENVQKVMEKIGQVNDVISKAAQNAGESMVGQLEVVQQSVGNVVESLGGIQLGIDKMAGLIAQQEIVAQARSEIEAEMRGQAAKAAEKVAQVMSFIPIGY